MMFHLLLPLMCGLLDYLFPKAGKIRVAKPIKSGLCYLLPAMLGNHVLDQGVR